MSADVHSGVLPARRHDLAEREVDGARLLLGPGAGPHVLDPLGAALFDSLDGQSPSSELVEDLAAALEQPVDDAARRLAAFLADLRSRGLLHDDEPAEAAHPAVERVQGWRYPVIPPSP